jgi:hypothetical protein
MTKTCGECRYYFEQANFCRLYAWECIEEDKGCCDDFAKPTNGDKIRQKSNEQFARDYTHYSKTHDLYVARLCPLSKQLWTTYEEALQANLDWLNAPAESEEEDE